MELDDLDVAVEDIAEGLGFSSLDDNDKQLDIEVGKQDEGTETPPTDEGEKELEVGKEEEKEKELEKQPVEDSAKTEPEVEPGPAPPKTWRPEATKDWDKLPAGVKAEVLKREEDMFKGIEAYKFDAGIGKAIKNIVAPHEEAIRKEGVEPLYLIKNLLNAHVVLSTKADQAQKQAVFQKLAQEYGVELDPARQVYQDPEVLSLKKTIAELNSRISTTENRTAEQIRASLKQEIDQFAADPKNIHFDAVSDDIAQLLKSGAAKDLQEAYDKAIYYNPTTRALEVQRLAAIEAEKAKKEAAEKVKAAREATAANVKATPKVGSGTAPVGSMEDTMKETLAKIKSRA